MLAVAIHEQHGAEPRMIETRQQGRFLAEVARQRHDLDVQCLGRQGVRHSQAVVAAAVIDIDHLGRKPALLPQLAGNLGELRVKLREAGALVEHGHDDRQPGLGLAAGRHLPADRGRVSWPCSRLVSNCRAIYSATEGSCRRTRTPVSRWPFRFAAPRKRSKRMPMAPPSRLSDRLIAAWHERAIVLKAMSFAVVGVVNSAVDFGVFSFAYYYLELPIVTANVMAWTVAVSGSYIMNSLTTFARESGRELRAKAYFSFVLSQVAGLVANTATVFVASYFMPVLLGKVLAIGASFLVNFSLSHFVVFRKRPNAG